MSVVVLAPEVSLHWPGPAVTSEPGFLSSVIVLRILYLQRDDCKAASFRVKTWQGERVSVEGEHAKGI